MKIKNVLVASFLAVTLLSACTKSITLSDGATSKKIYVYGKIEFNHDSSNTPILTFESVKGTKYSFNATNYNYKIK